MRSPIAVLILCNLFVSLIVGPMPTYAQDLFLPAPGKMVALSSAFSPVVLKGIKLDPKNPFRFHFFVDRGDSKLSQDELKQESSKLIKYFLASLTIPEKDLWVNLSPYEKDRIVPLEFGRTEMGRDLLAEDYMLKQITASMIYPESQLGKEFWHKVYAQAQAKYGTTNISVNTFNKVWIVPEKAVVYENGGVAFVLENHLKVMLEEDYLSLSKHQGRPGDMASAVSPSRLPSNEALNVKAPQGNSPSTSALASQIVRQIVIPALTKEVNEGKNFSQLRQVFYSLILATWYKNKIKDSILNKVYSNRNKIGGVNVSAADKDRIYHEYLKAFKKGVYNYIKEEPDEMTGQTIPRKYFSGGVAASNESKTIKAVGASEAMSAMVRNLRIDEIDGYVAMNSQLPNKLVNKAMKTDPHQWEIGDIVKDREFGYTLKVAGMPLKPVGQDMVKVLYIGGETYSFEEAGKKYEFFKDGKEVKKEPPTKRNMVAKKFADKIAAFLKGKILISQKDGKEYRLDPDRKLDGTSEEIEVRLDYNDDYTTLSPITIAVNNKLKVSMRIFFDHVSFRSGLELDITGARLGPQFCQIFEQIIPAGTIIQDSVLNIETQQYLTSHFEPRGDQMVEIATGRVVVAKFEGESVQPGELSLAEVMSKTYVGNLLSKYANLALKEIKFKNATNVDALKLMIEESHKGGKVNLDFDIRYKKRSSLKAKVRKSPHAAMTSKIKRFFKNSGLLLVSSLFISANANADINAKPNSSAGVQQTNSFQESVDLSPKEIVYPGTNNTSIILERMHHMDPGDERFMFTNINRINLDSLNHRLTQEEIANFRKVFEASVTDPKNVAAIMNFRLQIKRIEQSISKPDGVKVIYFEGTKDSFFISLNDFSITQDRLTEVLKVSGETDVEKKVDDFMLLYEAPLVYMRFHSEDYKEILKVELASLDDSKLYDRVQVTSSDYNQKASKISFTITIAQQTALGQFVDQVNASNQLVTATQSNLVMKIFNTNPENGRIIIDAVNAYQIDQIAKEQRQAYFEATIREGLRQKPVPSLVIAGAYDIIYLEEHLKKPSPAMNVAKHEGGINLNPAQMIMQVKKSGQDFKFDFDGTEIDAAQVTGATFTIESMEPVKALPSVLGLR